MSAGSTDPAVSGTPTPAPSTGDRPYGLAVASYHYHVQQGLGVALRFAAGRRLLGRTA